MINKLLSNYTEIIRQRAPHPFPTLVVDVDLGTRVEGFTPTPLPHSCDVLFKAKSELKRR